MTEDILANDTIESLSLAKVNLPTTFSEDFVRKYWVGSKEMLPRALQGDTDSWYLGAVLYTGATVNMTASNYFDIASALVRFLQEEEKCLH